MPPPAATQATARLWTARVTRSSFSWLASETRQMTDAVHTRVYTRMKNGHNSVTVENRTHVYINFFDHKDLGNHLPQLCPKVVKHLYIHPYSHVKLLPELPVQRPAEIESYPVATFYNDIPFEHYPPKHIHVSNMTSLYVDFMRATYPIHRKFYLIAIFHDVINHLCTDQSFWKTD
jgi:hypothetical protein